MPRMVFSVNEDKCTGCRTCEIMCAITKERVVSPRKSRIKIVDKYPMISRPIVCIQCANPACLEACLVGAIKKDKETGIVLVDPEKCNGCESCVEACEFDAIWVDPEKGTAVKCDWCMGSPACVKYCEPQAIRYIKQEEATQNYGERNPGTEAARSD